MRTLVRCKPYPRRPQLQPSRSIAHLPPWYRVKWAQEPLTQRKSNVLKIRRMTVCLARWMICGRQASKHPSPGPQKSEYAEKNQRQKQKESHRKRYLLLPRMKNRRSASYQRLQMLQTIMVTSRLSMISQRLVCSAILWLKSLSQWRAIYNRWVTYQIRWGTLTGSKT